MKTKRLVEIERRFAMTEDLALNYQKHPGVRKLTLHTFYTRDEDDFYRWRYIPELEKATVTNKLGTGIRRVELFQEVSVEEWKFYSANWFVDTVESWAYVGDEPEYKDTCVKKIVMPGMKPLFIFEQEFPKGGNISSFWEEKIGTDFIEVTDDPTMEYRNFYLSKLANIALSLHGGKR